MSGALPASPTAEYKTGKSSPGVSPLGIPLLAGPGSISTSIVYADVHPGFTHSVAIVGAIALVCVMTYVAFRIVLVFGDFISDTVATLMNRVSGLIVVAIAMHLLATGIKLQYGLS